MASIQEATKLLDSMIVKKRQFYDKKPNQYLLKEIDDLVEISTTIAGMNKLLGLIQSSYKITKAMYMAEFYGKVNPKSYANVEEWREVIETMAMDLRNQYSHLKSNANES